MRIRGPSAPQFDFTPPVGKPRPAQSSRGQSMFLAQNPSPSSPLPTRASASVTALHCLHLFCMAIGRGTLFLCSVKPSLGGGKPPTRKFIPAKGPRLRARVRGKGSDIPGTPWPVEREREREREKSKRELTCLNRRMSLALLKLPLKLQCLHLPVCGSSRDHQFEHFGFVQLQSF